MAAPSNSKPSSVSQTPPNNASARLEKTHPGIRRSTPDSEALASSDDDGEHPLPAPSTSVPAQKPARRTSWLNEIPVSMPRKASVTGPLSTGASNPTSPATEQSGWHANTSPGLNSSITWNNVGNSSFPWGTGIWNADSRKEPPPRLSELVPSPTMSVPSTASNYLAEELLSPTTRTTSGDSPIPFSIPLHPTPKTYRSQSYSVGQLDPEYSALNTGNKTKTTTAYGGGRSRNGTQFSALQHRSSRPSLLGELGHDPATLGRVREDEDDDVESPGGSDGSYSNLNADQARTIQQLSRENALLRQAAGQIEPSFRDRAMSTASAAGGYAVGGGLRNSHRIRGSVPEEGDHAVEDLDEVGNIPGYSDLYSNARRRFSEHSVNLEKQFSGFAPLENRALGRAHWQTSLGFGSLADIPQSRRHSFADIPIRHPSVSGDTHVASSSRIGLNEQDENYANISQVSVSNAPGQNREYQRLAMLPRPEEEHEMETEYLRARRFAESYFARDPSLRSAVDAQSPMNSPFHQSFNPYGRHQPVLPHQNQLLYIVTFKCHRADVFYIQEDTGLQVNPGDLVIVEADRGTDLGTIQHANISLQKARELKQQYAEEHYKWLMMFSRQGQSGAAGGVAAPGSVPGLGNRSAIGGMGSHGAHGVQESASEIKPKLIKRLAQNHEILTLRDKEGNEAKAKRVCQQKVAEHRLNMEILDAEFQMDWKKLTFYYFADSYINFNSLVTDLFKIYKTRIWMSAINPASFVTPPSAGLHSQNSLGYSQDTPGDRAHQRDGRGFGHSRDALDVGRDGVGLLRSGYSDTYQQFAHTSRQPEAGLGGLAAADPFTSYQPGGYGSLEYADYTVTSGGNAGPSRMQPAPGEWMNRFQGLSLNS